MRYYDYDKAKEIIKKYKSKGLISASLGMMEDWNWTAETIWQSGKYTRRFNKNTEIAGINKSYWATPVIELETENDIIKINCYKYEKLV